MRIEGGPFDQFILQARKLGAQNMVTANRIGKFVKPLPAEAEYLECDKSSPYSVVTYSDNSSKTSLTFSWQAPASNQGTFEFVYVLLVMLSMDNGVYHMV